MSRIQMTIIPQNDDSAWHFDTINHINMYNGSLPFSPTTQKVSTITNVVNDTPNKKSDWQPAFNPVAVYSSVINVEKRLLQNKST